MRLVQRAADGDALHLLRNLFERVELPPLQEKQHQQQHRRNTEEQAEQNDDRHQSRFFKRCFFLGRGPSSAIARASSIAEYRSPAHGISPYRGGHWRRARADAIRHLRRCRAPTLGRPAKTLNVPHPPPGTGLSPMLIGSSPRADGRAAGARLGCARRAHSRHLARGAARALRAAGAGANWRSPTARSPLPCGKRMLRPMLVGRILQALALQRRRAGARDRHRLGLSVRLPGRAGRPGAQPRTAPGDRRLARANLRGGRAGAAGRGRRWPTACSWPRQRATTSSC